MISEKELVNMGKQINFYMDMETEKRFLLYIKENGVLIYEGNNEKPTVIDSLPDPFSGKGWFKVYLYNNIGSLKLKRLSTGREIIDCIESPVIEFTRTVIREDSKEISKGRLWIETKYYSDDGDLIIKDDLLEEWFKLLSKWIKKNIPKKEFFNNGKLYKEYISESILSYLKCDYKLM
jgi:hypothetical protein